MKEFILKHLEMFVAFLGTGVTFVFGSFDATFVVLVGFMGCDFATGLLCGGKEKELSSKVAVDGVKKKIVMLIYFMVGVMIDRLMGNDKMLFRTLVAFYLVGVEGLSIVENGGKLGVPMPQKIIDTLVQLKDYKSKEV